MLPMREPVTQIVLEAPAGLVPVTAQCRDGKCVSVTFDNVPAFVFALERAIEVPGLGTVIGRRGLRRHDLRARRRRVPRLRADER